MLRVTIHDSADELRLRLEGRLAGAWVREAALCWETAQSTVAGRRVVVDLQNVLFVDDRASNCSRPCTAKAQYSMQRAP